MSSSDGILSVLPTTSSPPQSVSFESVENMLHKIMSIDQEDLEFEGEHAIEWEKVFIYFMRLAALGAPDVRKYMCEKLVPWCVDAIWKHISRGLIPENVIIRMLQLIFNCSSPQNIPVVEQLWDMHPDMQCVMNHECVKIRSGGHAVFSNFLRSSRICHQLQDEMDKYLWVFPRLARDLPLIEWSGVCWKLIFEKSLLSPLIFAKCVEEDDDDTNGMDGMITNHFLEYLLESRDEMIPFLNDPSDARTQWMVATTKDILDRVVKALSLPEIKHAFSMEHSLYLEKNFFEKKSLRNVPLMILLIAHYVDDDLILDSIDVEGGDASFELFVPIVENLFVSRDLSDEERGHLIRLVTLLSSSMRIPKSYFVERTNLIEAICVLLGMEYDYPFAFHWAVMSMRILCQDSDEMQNLFDHVLYTKLKLPRKPIDPDSKESHMN